MSIYDSGADNKQHNGQNYHELLGQLENNLMSDSSDNTSALDELGAKLSAQQSSTNFDSFSSLQDSDDSSEDYEYDESQSDEMGEQDVPAPERKKTNTLVRPGALVVFLLKNYIDREDNKLLFESLIRQEREVEEFCRRLFLRLVVDQDAGYAYVRSLSDEELPSDAGQRPPQLLSKRPLAFYDSFLLILLRQRLLEFDMSGQFGRLVLERSEIISLVKTFVHNVTNTKRIDDNVNKAIDNLCSLGLLSKIRSGASSRKDNKELDRIEIKRIISVIVTPEILKQADELLESYVKHIKEGGRAKNSMNTDEALDNESNVESEDL